MAALIVFPAIDLKAGQVVRLAEGDMDRATVYGDDPAAQALLFAQAGADYLHVVDLDGAFAGGSVNGDAVRGIVAAFPGHVQLGGGIRTRANVESWFDAGVSRVVIGTAALEDPEFVKAAARDFPGGIVVAVDAKVDLARSVDIPVIASGGVKGIGDIHVLALHVRDGVEGVITGRALYDGRLDLAAAMAVANAA